MFGDTEAFSGFAVDDLDRAQEFYEGTLGIRVKREDPMPLLTLQLAGGRDTMIYEKPDFAPATYTILNFVVEDIESAVEELRGKGVGMETYEAFDQDERGISHQGEGPKVAWFKDPAGNILSVLQT